MSRPELVQIPHDRILDVWPLIEDRVRRGVRNTRGRYTVEALRRKLLDRDWQLWLVWRPDGAGRAGAVLAVVVTELYRELSGQKVASVRFTIGENRADWIELVATLEGWAAAQGCHKLEAWARKGWARCLKDYKLTHVLLEKDLKPAERTADHGAHHDDRDS